MIRIPGARVLVEDIKTSMSLVEQARAAGLYIVTSERQEPKVTMGVVVAMGSDPFLWDEGIRLGSTVHFSRLAGHFQHIDGVQFRMLEFQEITMIEDPKPNYVQKPLEGRTPGMLDDGRIYGPESAGYHDPVHLPHPYPDNRKELNDAKDPTRSLSDGGASVDPNQTGYIDPASPTASAVEGGQLPPAAVASEDGAVGVAGATDSSGGRCVEGERGEG